MPDNRHDLVLSAEGCHRVAVAQGFGIRYEVWLEAIVFLRPAIGNTKTRLNLIQNKDTAIFFCLFADEL